jgi:hypothetical protein
MCLQPSQFRSNHILPSAGKLAASIPMVAMKAMKAMKNESTMKAMKAMVAMKAVKAMVAKTTKKAMVAKTTKKAMVAKTTKKAMVAMKAMKAMKVWTETYATVQNGKYNTWHLRSIRRTAGKVTEIWDGTPHEAW